MSTMTQIANPVSHAPAAQRASRSVVADGGPWVILALPISFALIVAINIYLSSISF